MDKEEDILWREMENFMGPMKINRYKVIHIPDYDELMRFRDNNYFNTTYIVKQLIFLYKCGAIDYNMLTKSLDFLKLNYKKPKQKCMFK